MQNQKLIQGCKKLSIDLSEAQEQKLNAYIDHILDFNKTYNLMRADNQDELTVNHILDSLAGLKTLQEQAASFAEPCTVADIGSGGGCPGIPLAVMLDKINFVLVERMEKRCAFLNRVVSDLALKNVSVLCSATQDVPHSSFDIEVFRAFHPFDKKIVKNLFAMLKENGTIIAYKARSEKITQEMDGIKDLITSYKKVPLTVPFLEDHERNLVVIKKSV